MPAQLNRERVVSPRSVTRRDALRLAFVGGMAALSLPTVASALTTQQKLDAAQYNYDQAQAALDSINQEYATIAGELSKTQGQIVDLSGQISQTQDQIDHTQSEIDQRQHELEEKQRVLGQRMSSAYKSGPQSALDVLLSSSTFEELTSNIYYLDKVSESDRAMIEEVRALKSQLEQQKTELEQQKSTLEGQLQELEDLRARQEEQLAAAQAKQDDAQALVSSLSGEVRQLMEQRDAELMAAQQAAEEARRIEAERRSQQSSSSTSRPSRRPAVVPANGSGPLAAVISAAYSTPSPGSGLCAAWVTQVMSRAGIGYYGGNACDMYYWYCGTSTSNIQPGMIIAVPTCPYGAAAMTYGHVGIYLGNGTVRHNQSGVVSDVSLGSWVSMYNRTATVLCGWLGGVALS